MKTIVYLIKVVAVLSMISCTNNSKESSRNASSNFELSNNQKEMICNCAKVQLKIISEVKDSVGDKLTFTKEDSMKVFEIVSKFKEKTQDCNKFNLSLSNIEREAANKYLSDCDEAKKLDDILQK